MEKKPDIAAQRGPETPFSHGTRLMNRHVKKVAVLIAGWSFIVLGIAGLFLPVLQGILFLCIGLVILSTEYVWAHHLLNHFKTRFPRIAKVIVDAETWVARHLHHEKR